MWTGTDGIYPVDQLQYMAWIRDASHHVLASDMYVLRATPHDYLEPLVALAGGLTALGMAPWAALLVFQPLAVVAIFFAIRAFMHRSLPGLWERRAGLILALFFGSFVVLFAPFAGPGKIGGPGVPDEWIPFWTWGYLPGVFAIAAMVGALVVYDRAMKERRFLWLAPILGLLASWLHPWQGEELLLILVVYELSRRTQTGRRLLESEQRLEGAALPSALGDGRSHAPTPRVLRPAGSTRSRLAYGRGSRGAPEVSGHRTPASGAAACARRVGLAGATPDLSGGQRGNLAAGGTGCLPSV